MQMLKVCWRAAGWSSAARIASTRSSTWTKFRFTGRPSASSITGTVPRLDVRVGLLGADQVAPARPAEHVLAERELVLEVVLLHDPRRAQAAAVQVVLDAVLLEHHLLEHLRQRVAAGVGACASASRSRGSGADRRSGPTPASPPIRMNCSERRARAAGLEQPEQPLDRHVHDRLGRLLARRQVQHVRDARPRPRRPSRVLDRAGRPPRGAGRGSSLRLWHSARTLKPAKRSSARARASRAMNAWPTLPVAPVTRIRFASLTASSI